MDRALSAATHRRRRLRASLLTAAVVGAIVVGLLAFRSVLQPRMRRAEILTATVDTGPVEASLTAAGTLIPAHEAVLTSPIASTVRRVVRQVGQAVQPGQPILELDKELTASELARLQDAQQQHRNKHDQLRLTLERTLNDLRAQEQVQQARVGSLQSALRDEQYLLKIGGGTAESVRQAELNLTVARLELRRLQEQIGNQRRASAADVRELGYTMQMQQRSIAELAARLAQADISSRQAGVLTWVNEDLGSTVRQGDVLARVADLSSFRVRATIADTYADALHPDDAVVVRLNATTDLRGTITTISPAADKGAVTFYVRLQQDHHPLLRANLRADVFVITSAHPRAVRVRNGPFYQGGREQPVFVVQADRLVRRTVRFGASNFDYVQVVSGLRPGEQIVLSDMKDHQDTPQLRLTE